MQFTKLMVMAALVLTGSLAMGGVGQAQVREPLCTRGEIVEVPDNSIVVKGEGDYDCVKLLLDTKEKKELKPSVELQGRPKTDLGLNIGLECKKTVSGTLILDGANGRPIKAKKLTLGKEVFAYYGARVTRSLPPQAKAEAVVLVTKPERIGRYFVVKKAELSKDGKAVIVTNTNNDLIATIPGRSCSDYREIKEGTKIMLWYDIVALSMPGKTVATKARILD